MMKGNIVEITTYFRKMLLNANANANKYMAATNMDNFSKMYE